MGLQAYEESTPVWNYEEIVTADGLNYVDLIASQRGIWRIDSIRVSSNDTIDHEVQFCLNDGANKAPVGCVTVPAGAGWSAAVPCVDIVDELAHPTIAGFIVGPYLQVTARVQVAMSADKTLQFTIQGGTV